MAISPNISFVCCVESGALESQTVRMVESLRRWGGMFSNAPVYAVTPRLGPPLSRKTHQIFDRCEIEHLSIRPPSHHSKYSWNNFMNKPNAILAVDEQVKTEAVAWLDSDLLIVGEPSELVLQSDESFLACTADQIGATTGLNDPMESYWQVICRNLGLDIESLPWVTTEQEQAKVRYYFNSGMFVYRRETDFAKRYLETCLTMLDNRVSSKLCGFFFTDQVALGLTARQLTLPWRSLSYSHNYPMGSASHQLWYNRDLLQRAKIVHHHDAMWQPFWATFLECMQETHPNVANWLASIGPMQNNTPLHYKLLSKALKYSRELQEKAYKKSCQVV